MTICEYAKNIILVELPPEPDIRPELNKLMKILDAGTNSDVIIDFSQVDIMTSMTLSGFLKVREKTIEVGRRLIFANASSITRDIFTVTCFDGVFEFADNRDQAVEILTENVQFEQSSS